MIRLKKMPVKIRKQLEKAAESVSNGAIEWYCLHNFDLLVKTAMSEEYTLVFNQLYDVINCNKQIQLMAIALMLTMPEEIINHECTP